MISKENVKYYRWGQRCESWVLKDKDQLSIKLESMPAGSKERLHFHTKSEQFFFILKGRATFYVENEKEIIEENQGISIKPTMKHFIANETESRLEFLVISQPSTNNDRVSISE